MTAEIEKTVKPCKKEKINKTKIDEISELPHPPKPYEILDTELPGYLIRVQPTGVISFIISYRWKGKRNRITIGQSSKINAVQARKKAGELLAAITLGNDPATLKVSKTAPVQVIKYTLGTFINNKYKDWCEAHQDDGAGTIKRLVSSFSSILDTPLEEVSKLIVEEWRTARLKSGISPSTINRDINALKSLISSAAEWKFLSTNTLSGLSLMYVDDYEFTRYLDKDEEARLLDALVVRENEMVEARERANAWREQRGYPLFAQIIDPLRPMVITALKTGVRRRELLKLEWNNVDFTLAHITVTASTSRKSKKTRHIKLSPVAKNVLLDWHDRIGKKKQGLVFPSPTGEVMHDVNTSWGNLKKRAGITNFRWHDLRHSFASKLVMAGIDLNTVRELMGHSDIKQTLRYAHLAPEHKAAAVAFLD